MTTPLETLDGILPYAIRYKMGSGVYMVPEAGQRASGVPRSSKPLTIQTAGDGQLSITTTPRPNGGAQSTSTASLHIYPLPN